MKEHLTPIAYSLGSLTKDLDGAGGQWLVVWFCQFVQLHTDHLTT